MQHRVAQGIDAVRQVDGVALRLHRRQRVEHRLEDRQVGGAADVAGVGREVEDHDRHLALGPLAAAQGHQLGDPRCQHLRALRAGVHVLGVVGGCEIARVVATGAGDAGRARAATEHDRAGGPIEFGDRHHDGAFHRQQPSIGTAPLIERLELDRVGRHVRHIEPRQHVLGGLRVVVGRPADEREAGQGHHGIDGDRAVLDEELVDRRPGIQSGGEGRNDPQTPCLQGRDHAVVVPGVVGQQIRAQHQHPDRSRGAWAGWGWQLGNLFGQAPRHARVVHADLRVIDRGGDLHQAAQGTARTIGPAVDDMPQQVEHVLVGSAQPVLKRHEISAHVLSGARNESQHLRNAPQHLHLRRTARSGLLLVSAQLLEQRHRPAGGLGHVEVAEPGELDDLTGRRHADHGVAVLPPRAQVVEDRQEVVFEEEHAGHDDVGFGDVRLAALDGGGVARVLGRGMQRQLQTGVLALERRMGALDRAC